MKRSKVTTFTARPASPLTLRAGHSTTPPCCMRALLQETDWRHSKHPILVVLSAPPIHSSQAYSKMVRCTAFLTVVLAAVAIGQVRAQCPLPTITDQASCDSFCLGSGTFEENNFGVSCTCTGNAGSYLSTGNFCFCPDGSGLCEGSAGSDFIGMLFEPWPVECCCC
jgi:hypothetical protein